MRVVFFGSPPAAIPTLEALLDSEVDVSLIVTQPGGGRRRGKRSELSAVATFAAARAIEVRSPERVAELTEELADLACEAGVVVAYGQIISREVIDLFPLGILNLHFSLLPRWRGAAPVQRAILAGDRMTGVSVMRISEGLDAGPVYASIETAIAADESTDELTERLAATGAPLVVEILHRLPGRDLQPVEQSTEGVTFAAKLSREECEINWSRPAEEVGRLVRAASPTPGAWSVFRSQPIKILRVRIAPPPLAEAADRDSKPGLLKASRRGLWAFTGDVPIELTEVQPAGRRAMTGIQFAAGARLNQLDCLGGTPAT